MRSSPPFIPLPAACRHRFNFYFERYTRFGRQGLAGLLYFYPMRKIAATLLFSLALVVSRGQQLATEEFQKLKENETALVKEAEGIIDDEKPEDRIRRDSAFTRLLVKSLKTPYSFQYPFDSLYTISRLYAPDSSFRIITWQLEITPGSYRQHGAIQMNTPDGQLKLFPLIDRSESVTHYSDSIGDNLGWIGAVYYNIIKKAFEGKSYYTLLGFDENSFLSNKKIIEILDMTGEKPVFGKRIFSSGTYARFVMEYKKAAGARLNYDPELDLILVEHLVSETNQPQKKYTLIGDADYDGFKWENGMWMFVEKIMANTPAAAEIPVPSPVTESKLDFREIPQPKSKEKKKKN